MRVPLASERKAATSAGSGLITPSAGLFELGRPGTIINTEL